MAAWLDSISELPLSETDATFRDEVRTWLDEHLVGDFRNQAHRGGPDDDDNWQLRRAWEAELAAGGWLGLSWPSEYGGRAATLTQEIVFAMEYARAGAPPRAAFHGETLMAPAALAHGTEQQKARLLPPMARAEVVWCQGYSEPGAGSDLANVACRARRDGDQWVVSGEKIWTTFAHHADWIFAIVRTEPGSVRHAGLSYLLIPLDQPGVRVTPIRTMLGDSGFNSVYFDDARTSTDNRAWRRGLRLGGGDDHARARARHLGAQLPVLVRPRNAPAARPCREARRRRRPGAS